MFLVKFLSSIVCRRIFHSRKLPLSRYHYALERLKGAGWFYHLRAHIHSNVCVLDLGVSVFTMRTSMVTGEMVIISS
jgi:hypothetical protein